MLKSTRKEGTDLYREHNTQVLLGKFLSGEIVELEPTYDPKTGYHYPIVEAIIGGIQESEQYLQKLYENKILDRKLFDKTIYCPKCQSPNMSTRYCCPYCQSFNMQKSSLVEHIKCGYMDIEQNFQQRKNLFCPKCHEELKRIDVDYRRAGIWCTCEECNKSFDIPTTAHHCRDCHANATFEEVTIKDVYTYTLGEETRNEATVGWVMVTPIREFLEQNDYRVESPAFLKGKSGANHMFDIAAYKGEVTRKVVVIDLSMSTETIASEQPVIALFAKTFDVSPDGAFLIAIPKMSENGKKMAELYNIEIIEAKNQKEAVKALKERI